MFTVQTMLTIAINYSQFKCAHLLEEFFCHIFIETVIYS